MTTNDLSAASTPLSHKEGEAPLRWLTWLFEPHQSLTDELSRRRAQLLSGMMFVSVLVGTIGIVWNILANPSTRDDVDTWIVVLALITLSYALVINRLGQVTRAAQIFTGIMIPVFTVVPFVEGGDRQLSFFAVIPILVSGIFFSVRTSAIIAVGSTIAVMVFSISAMGEGSGWLMPTLFLSMSGGLVYLFIRHLQFQEHVRTSRLREMNLLLQASEESLEQRVQERTRDLQVAADVSLEITTQLDPTHLLAAVVERTARAFNLYHVSVFLYDEYQQVLHMKQGVGDAGDAMVAMGKQFLLTERGLVPLAAKTQQPTLSNDVSENTDHFANPLLPETRSELAIPMIYRGTLVGVLDIQSEQVNRFRDDDIRIMRTLAEQIAVAIRNSQLFEETTIAKEAAEKADNVKSAFLASMSHELRTPLNAIINFSKFLKRGIPGPINKEQDELIGSIADSGQHLLNLINDVLDMSKIEAGSLKLFIEQGIDMRQIIETAIQYTHPMLADKPVEMQQDIPDVLPTITGDRKRLLQIFLNVLSNACKFTDEGYIKINVLPEPQHLLFAVNDTGAGIAPEDADYVFTAFKQTESGLRQGGGGTGLGMPICQKLIEAHEGRIWFESEPGVGTTFFVELPLKSTLKPERSN
ncbi:MAG: GAF domain-containing protein [Anaerolineaceae bacterium]|nr:GAF domain-containing protein [Anaerolineaceae bacterium]